MAIMVGGADEQGWSGKMKGGSWMIGKEKAEMS